MLYGDARTETLWLERVRDLIAMSKPPYYKTLSGPQTFVWWMFLFLVLVGLIAAIPVRLMRQSHALIIRLGPYSALGVR